jgi:hypothetical protein
VLRMVQGYDHCDGQIVLGLLARSSYKFESVAPVTVLARVSWLSPVRLVRTPSGITTWQTFQSFESRGREICPGRPWHRE